MSSSPVKSAASCDGKTSQDLCQVCSSIDLEALFQKELNRAGRIRLGPWDQIFSKRSQCPFCGLLVAAIDSARVATGRKPTTVMGTSDRSSLSCSLENRVAMISEASNKRFVNAFGSGWRGDDGLWHFRISVFVSGWVEVGGDTGSKDTYDHTFAELQQVRPPSRRLGIFDELPVFGKRPVHDTLQLDYSLAKRWLAWCESNHGKQCAHRSQPSKIPILRAIDVLKNCVVEISSERRYVALSYVWGAVQMLRLTTANESELRQEASLSLGRVHIPQTIRDAMALAQKLGERYIWVDSLCIIQDDDSDSERYISKMDLIYSGAVLTIVAAAGADGEAMLPGVHPYMRDRGQMQYTAQVPLPSGPQDLAVASGLLLPLLEFSKWDSRGWTLQERAFSHRLLYFTSEQVYFQCRRSTWCEDTVLEVDDPMLQYEDMPLYRFGIPKKEAPPALDVFDPEDAVLSIFELYTKVVAAFARRDLTYEGDVLKAFGGLAREVYHMDYGFVTAEMEDQKEAYFHFGMPSPWFERAVLWTPADSSTNNRTRLRRRVMPHGASQIPSWSWAGWVGPVGYQGLQFGTGDEDVKPAIMYHISLPSDPGKIHPMHDTKRYLPDGPTWFPKNRPMRVTESDQIPLPPHILSFYTSRAFLPVIRDEAKATVDAQPSPLGPMWRWHYIGKRYAHVSNRMLLPSDWKAARHQESWSQEDSDGEFIVLSAGRYGYLSVMLIRRDGIEVDGVAERVGIGNISEVDWMAAVPEWTLIRLG
ncbi:HET-domain-containing protein [Stipitochalara longipes BDJ]|nr:HET-domain-containing protein [Stipitochalara longipes BDJ]